MKPTLSLVAVLSLTLFAIPAFAADGNIYLTGHDLDFHCAFESAPTQCNALKIAIALARAGAPDPNQPVLFLDQGMSAEVASFFGKEEGDSELALAAQNAGLTTSQYQVVKPNSIAFTGDFETTPALALTTASYSAIIIASHVTCSGCDNTDNAVAAINGRTEDIRAFFAAGGGLVYLAGATKVDYYQSVPTAYAVAPTATSPGSPEGCFPEPAEPSSSCYQLTTAGRSLGLTNDDANCCQTHNSFTAQPPPPPPIGAPSLESATNVSLISAETDGISEGTPKDETLYAVGASSGGQAAVLTFTPTQTSQTATFNCTSNATPCPDADAHSMKVSVAGVTTPFTLVLTATEVHGDGTCQSGNPNDATDYDCRFVKFFGKLTSPTPDNKVPLCYPYASNGNCVFYDISGTPPRTSYTSPVLEYIAWNNTLPTTPIGYLSTPHMYDDPSDDANLCHCYPVITSTPSFPYSPEDNQYVFDITTFFKEEAMQVGKDPGTGGKTVTFNQFGIALPLASNDSYKWISPLSTNSNVVTAKKGSTLPVKFQLRDATGSIVSNAVVPPNFVRIAVLDNNGVSQPVIASNGGFVYDGSKQQYQTNLSTSPYVAGVTYTITVNGNLFSQQIARFKVTK